ncbi:MAG: class I SAM-dependent methyltransferase [Gaiellaceae bacterium]
MIRKLALALGAAIAAIVVFERVRPMPCPYALRWMVEVPRPGLTPAAVIDALAPRQGEAILEVGPGTGYHSIAVARELEPGGTLHAFDVQQQMLDALMRRAGREGVTNVEPLRGDARELPYGDASLDGAFLQTVLGEIPDGDVALRELHRVIRPGGRLVVGEIVADPHFVRASKLRRRAEAAGFRFERRRGPAISFQAVFTRAG